MLSISYCYNLIIIFFTINLFAIISEDERTCAIFNGELSNDYEIGSQLI